ncbi:MAG: MMPL family transporter, partial [Chloroflexota bacterium]|nr:MMPL family transporter [Chloroflexota bacterium]
AGGDYSSNFSLPGAESQHAFDLLKQRFPQVSGDTADIVFKADQGVNDAAVRQRLEGYFAQVTKLPLVDSVADPYTPENVRAISQDGHIAFAEVQFKVQAGDVPKAEVDRLEALGRAAAGPAVEIEFGGQVIQQAQFQPPGGAEAVGLVAAILILLVTFGSLLAMGLPIMTALFGIGIGLSLLLLFANFLNVPNFTPQVASMIGIGVGIDYALFIVTRYRQGLHEGRDPEEAVVTAMVTAGRAVIFAGTIVVISLLGILLMGFSFVQGIAVGGAAAVFVTMIASITLLPAVLGFVGQNIDKLHIPRLRRVEHAGQRGFWYRWSRLIQRRPWAAGIAGLIALVVLALPLFSMRLGAADAGNDPESLTTRRAYDLLSNGFGPGFNGPLVLVAELPNAAAGQSLQTLVARVQSTPDVAFVGPPIPNAAGNTAIITVYPKTSPQDSATSDLVHRLRDQVVPQATQGTGVHVFVGGITAVFVDFAAKIGARLPILIGVVIVLSFLLLMAVFRSILVPVKAAVMNLLSIGAAYGVMVAVFQFGWGKSIIGVGKTGPIESWVPMMMFTILFGLSMDYEIFLLSRIREEYLRTRVNATSVADGVAITGRVITAAAAIMIAVFLSFVLGFDIRQIKEIGLGLAVAVLIDATLVRMILVPATMELLGDANWWFPRWLNRIVPRIAVEREAE